MTEGSYIKEITREACSSGFVLECTAGRGRIIGSFPEQSKDACAYRGELLGLLAIHLVLLAANKLEPQLKGSVEIVSDCLGALYQGYQTCQMIDYQVDVSTQTF